MSVSLALLKQFSALHAAPLLTLQVSEVSMEASNSVWLIISEGRLSPLPEDSNPLLIGALAVVLNVSVCECTVTGPSLIPTLTSFSKAAVCGCL